MTLTNQMYLLKFKLQKFIEQFFLSVGLIIKILSINRFSSIYCFLATTQMVVFVFNKNKI